MPNKLKAAVEKTHGCEACYVRSVPINEQFEGITAWQGIVDVFNLTGHAKAKRCYAWTYKEGRQTKFVAVLEIPPVDSAESAVKVAIASRARK
jgi:hypothetical protein